MELNMLSELIFEKGILSIAPKGDNVKTFGRFET